MTELTEEQQATILAALDEGATLTTASRRAKTSVRKLQRLRQLAPGFNELVEKTNHLREARLRQVKTPVELTDEQRATFLRDLTAGASPTVAAETVGLALYHFSKDPQLHEALAQTTIVCPTAEIVPIVQAALEEIEDPAPLTRLSVQLAVRANITTDGAYKRLKLLLRHNSPTIKASTADEILLACNRFIELEDVTHLPTNKRAAEAMLAAYQAEINPDDDRTLTAKSLLHFAQGFLTGLAEAEAIPETAEAIAA